MSRQSEIVFVLEMKAGYTNFQVGMCSLEAGMLSLEAGMCK